MGLKASGASIIKDFVRVAAVLEAWLPGVVALAVSFTTAEKEYVPGDAEIADAPLEQTTCVPEAATQPTPAGSALDPGEADCGGRVKV